MDEERRIPLEDEPFGPEVGNRPITIVIGLPQPVDNVVALLRVIGRLWPEVKVDTSGPDGWVIRLPADG